VTKRVLIVDDENDLRRLLCCLLETEGYEVAETGEAQAALQAVASWDPDIVLLDIMLGDEDGRELLGQMRRLSDVPVVFLSGRGHEVDRIAGLKSGADDYLVKPFSPGELAARMEAVLRRSGSRQQASAGLTFGPLAIDPLAREVILDEQPVDLTPKEFDLLAFLAASPRRVFSREELLDKVWSSSTAWQDPDTVTEHVRRIRHKIESDPDRPEWIKTVRGAGYRFDPAAWTRQAGALVAPTVPELVSVA
jgi:DNA-binding response OmpR family regulator